MRQGAWRHSAALAVAAIALFVALGGSVYAAKQARINGQAIRAKSIPGNRLKPHSIAANRLKQGILHGGSAAGGPLTGADINELTLGQVPSATHADSADTALSALDAQTAVNAVNAVDAKTVNGHSVGCFANTRPFAGACWDSSSSSAVDAPTAARKCATRGGALPEALQLAAFAEEEAVNLNPGDEWSSDILSFTSENVYAVATVSPGSDIASGLYNSKGTMETHAYRCVFPLLT